MKKYKAIDSVLEVNEAAWDFYNSNPKNQRKNNMGTPEVKKLLISLAANKVDYILIGGFAMAFHGHVRATNDIDLWIRNTPLNMSNLRKALIDMGIPEAIALRDTTQLVGFSVFNLLETDFKVDLLHNLKAFKEIDFDTCLKRSMISDYNGISIPVLDANDLLKEKKETAREKDRGDIAFLKKLFNLD